MNMPRVAASLVLALAFLSGCGDDDDGGDVDAFCEQLARFDGEQAFPSDDELDRIAATAPDEIRSDVDAAVAVLKDAGEEVIGDPALDEHLDAIAEYRDAECSSGS